MAKSIGVNHGGGRLRNREGAEGEPDIFRKRARWLDYSGQMAEHFSSQKECSAFFRKSDKG